VKTEQLNELIYQMLETERGGMQVYETALRCVVNDELKEEWEKYLDQTKSHERIVLELTEAAEVSNFARARERVAALRAAGFRIAVDDLGSGYSSLNSLALLEPDFVKLDMAMIRGIEEGGRAARLIKHILEYCRGEGMRAVCEGIETQEELRVVAALGVSLVQGFLLARPGPPFPGAALGAAGNPRRGI